jgi:hypothetical protein
MSEEEAFWTLSTICEDFVPDYYTAKLQLLGSIVDQQIFSMLVEKNLNQVFLKLKKVGTGRGGKIWKKRREKGEGRRKNGEGRKETAEGRLTFEVGYPGRDVVFPLVPLLFYWLY